MTRSFGLLAAALAVFCFTSPAQATLFKYFANLDGPSEPTASLGTGFATVNYDSAAHTLALHVDFTGLGSPTTNSHIHAPTAAALSGTANVATTTPTFAGFPMGVTSGSYTNTLDLTLASSYNPSYVSGLTPATTAQAEIALAAAMADGKAYWNIHTQQFGSGEIRGFLKPVPEPVTLALVAFGAVSLANLRRRRA